MLVAEKIKIALAVVGPTFIGFGLIACIASLSLQVAQADDAKLTAMKEKVASCPALPQVVWWKTTHLKIVKHVDFKYSGNWIPYIQKWENYKKKLQAVFENGGTAVVETRNINLSGDKLKKHLMEIDQRLAVIRCLKAKFSGQLVNNRFDELKSIQKTNPKLPKISRVL
jgi:hypothetical protein